jgi:glycosyltransferase involved in cell wall biosynthesis
MAVCTAGFALAKMCQVKTVFDLSDFFPSSVLAYPDAQGAKGKLIYDLATVITNANIRMVDLCTACSTALGDYAKCISPKTKVESLPNGVDTRVFTPRKPSRRLEGSLGLDGEILTFVGSIESWLDFDLVLEALGLLKKEGVKVHLLIIGRSIYSTSNQNLMRKIRDCGLEDQVHFLGYQPYETVPEFINLSCGGLIPFRSDNLLTRMAFPNKLLEYLACGKPVLAPAIGDMKRVGGRYLLEYTDRKSLALQIKRAISSDFDPYDVRKLVVDYDWNSIADKLQAFMRGLLD